MVKGHKECVMFRKDVPGVCRDCVFLLVKSSKYKKLKNATCHFSQEKENPTFVSSFTVSEKVKIQSGHVTFMSSFELKYPLSFNL